MSFTATFASALASLMVAGTVTMPTYAQQARAVARLNHPSIMTIFDVGKDGDKDYIVVELVTGQPLYEFIPSPAEQVARIDGYRLQHDRPSGCSLRHRHRVDAVGLRMDCAGRDEDEHRQEPGARTEGPSRPGRGIAEES